MCGIAGFYCAGGFNNESASRQVRKMADAIKHRGPDDSGEWVDGSQGIAMAHRRLSILDLSPAGMQPMHSHGNKYVICFNGEIYNHHEIRSDLIPANIPWRGSSDTESLLAAIEEWGVDRALRKTVGMFAFALWDKQKNELTIARDRLGEKPLYYGYCRDYLFFGSELKALKAHPQFVGEIDNGSVALLMRHNYVPAPYSIYQGVKKLEPGSYLTFSKRKIQAHESVSPARYWSLKSVAQSGQTTQFAGTEEEAALQLEDLLTQAVRGQMAADVPVGAFLSGGLDSSTIVALMQQQSSRPVRTFTVGFQEEDYNEAKYAKRVAEHLKTDHTELYVSPKDARAVIPDLPKLYDEPFADSSQIPTHIIAKLTRQQVTVALSGDGGDEFLGGYNRYIWTRDMWNLLNWVPSFAKNMAAKIIHSQTEDRWNQLYRLLTAILPKRFEVGNPGVKAHKVAHISQEKSPDLIYRSLISHWKTPCEIVCVDREPSTVLTTVNDGIPPQNIEHRMMLLDGLSYLPDDLLVKIDRAAMGVSLETRVPFLDHRVVEFAWSLPISFKIDRNRGKKPLRRILRKHVPDVLVDRPKMGFAIPLGDWLRNPLRDWAEDLLAESALARDGVFHPQKIRSVWKQHLEGNGDAAHRLWGVLMYQSWRQTH